MVEVEELGQVEVGRRAIRVRRLGLVLTNLAIVPPSVTLGVLVNHSDHEKQDSVIYGVIMMNTLTS